MPELLDSKQMLDITIQQVRGISHRLLPPILEEYGLVNAIEGSCEKMNSDNLELQVCFDAEYKRLPNETELALYRVIMELLNNIVKHSQATQAEVKFTQNNNLYEIRVSDNGVGFDPTALNEKAGLGLKNIKSRLSTINASIAYTRSPGKMVATIKPIQV